MWGTVMMEIDGIDTRVESIEDWETEEYCPCGYERNRVLSSGRTESNLRLNKTLEARLHWNEHYYVGRWI